ncbi:hypothetical protein [Leeuwenhoekiella marinoflava]|nr:hypothetical protein [Leeuwenhoekiella marinoflava]
MRIGIFILPGLMLFNPLPKIRGYTGVIGFIPAFKDVDTINFHITSN